MTERSFSSEIPHCTRIEAGAEALWQEKRLIDSREHRRGQGYTPISFDDREHILNANGSLDVVVLDTDIALPIYIDFPLVGTKIIGLTVDKEHLPTKAVVRIKPETFAARLALASSVSSAQQPYYAKVEIHPSEPEDLLKIIDKFKEEKEHLWRDIDTSKLNPELQQKVRERCELERRWVELYS